MTGQTYIRKFAVDSFTTEDSWYRIEVRARGSLIEVFERPTMREAQNAFAAAGYIPAHYSRYIEDPQHDLY